MSEIWYRRGLIYESPNKKNHWYPVKGSNINGGKPVKAPISTLIPSIKQNISRTISNIFNPKLSPNDIGTPAEKALRRLTNGEKAGLRTSAGMRYIDSLDDSRIAHEAKVGATGLSDFVGRQVEKDLLLFRDKRINGIQWHFYRSPITGKLGPTPELRALLETYNIPIVMHDEVIKPKGWWKWR